MEIPSKETNKTSWWKFDLLNKSDLHYELKIWVWVYFFLWVFEGALRKWFLPFLSTPLLIVRDPIVLWLIILATRKGLLKFNIYLTGMVILGVIGFFTAVFFGHGNVFVSLYGARTLMLYFPMIFIVGKVFDKEDVIKLGKIMLLIAIPMTVLLGLQFYSPQSAWVNRGIGGDEEGSGFGGALGYFRPSSTFSFTNGTTFFYSLVAPFLLFFLLNPEKIDKKILIGAAVALIAAIPMTISRGLLLQVGVSLVFLVLAVSRKPKYMGKLLIGMVIVIAALNIFSNLSFFKTSTEAFTERFESANEEEGGLAEGVMGERFLGQLVNALFEAENQSFFGFGIGSGTTLGAKLLNEYRIVMMADYEWMRIIGEFGLMGLFVVFIRVGLTVKLSLVSYTRMLKSDMLPWLLMSLGSLTLLQGSWQQPTALGFCSLISGLWLASFKNREVI